jgi:cyclophilin family peptidyl-prolyl cis-trans isomerase
MFRRYTRYALILAGLTLTAAILACGGEETETTEPTGFPTSAAAPEQSQPTAQPIAKPAQDAAVKQYSAPPPMTIDPDGNYTATFKMAKGGEFVVELYPKEAPVTVNSFVFLARDSYYDGITFHRVIGGFMAQGGDPTGTGTSGPGYTFENEPSPLRRHDTPGTLSMANSGVRNGNGTNGSQFFITFAPTLSLDGNNPDGSLKNCAAESCHTVFGRVIQGMDVVNAISIRDPGTARTPGDAITTIIITKEEETTIKQYSAPPPMTINPDKKYTATFQMAKGGEFVVELYPKEAPVTVNSFVFLARDGYYDGITFHRVIAGFMAQGGDPTGTGTSGPGYTFDNEPSPLRRHDTAGTLSMANAGERNRQGTNGSQFFITFVPTPNLDGNNPDGSPKNCAAESCHTVFGRVIQGMDVVNAISVRDPGTARTAGDAMTTIAITEE